MSCCAPEWLEWINCRLYRNMCSCRLMFQAPGINYVISLKTSRDEIAHIAQVVVAEAARHGLVPDDDVATYLMFQQSLLKPE